MLTTEEAAKVLNERLPEGVSWRGEAGRPITAVLVQTWCQRGILPCRRVGKNSRGPWLIDPACLEGFTPPRAGRRWNNHE